jgi:hypothetical protein
MIGMRSMTLAQRTSRTAICVISYFGAFGARALPDDPLAI